MSPIKPEHRHHYSAASGWPRLRLAILERAKGRCEWPGCGAKNHAIGYHDHRGAFHELHTDAGIYEAKADGERVVRIVLTVAHMDQDGHLGTRDPERLRAWCQKHHCSYDAAQRAVNASRTNALKRVVPGQQNLFGSER